MAEPSIPDDLSQLPAWLHDRPGRVLAARHRGARVWIKRADAARPAWLYGLLDAVTWLARTPALRAVPRPGGPKGIETERRRLAELGAAGVRVPRVLAHGEDWLCLSDLGAPLLLDALKDREGPPRLALWERGLDAVVSVHAAAACLSQCFARNMVVGPEGSIGFIDFEDDPLCCMDLPQAQARDWALYLFSTAALVGEDRASVPMLLRALRAEPANTRAQTLGVLRRMRWLSRLPASARWGRDVRLARAAGRFARDVVAATGARP